MFHMRLAQALQPCLANALRKPKEPRLHIRRKGGDFIGDRIVQDFNSPSHIRLYLNFEMEGRDEKGHGGARASSIPAPFAASPARCLLRARSAASCRST